MRDPDEPDEPVLGLVERGEGDDSPADVAEDHGQAEGGRDHEEVRGLAAEAHGARPDRVGEHVDQGEGPGHHAEAEAHD